MFTKIIIHKKNLILLKFLISLLLIILLSVINNYINKEKSEYIKILHNSQEELTKSALAFYSIASSKEKMLSTYNKYIELLNQSDILMCSQHELLANNIISLGNQYNLLEPITVQFEQIFFNNIIDNIINKNDVIIKSFNVTVKFSTTDFINFLSLVKAIYAIMPSNTILISLKTNKQDTIEPKMVYKLNTHVTPNLIFTKLVMRIRIITINR
jgi:hypothetical protein